MAEGARLESVFTRKGNVGSNPTLSAILLKINRLDEILNPLLGPSFVFGMGHMRFCRARCVPLRLNRLLNRFIQADCLGTNRT